MIQEVWAFRTTRIAVRFAYEWHTIGHWFRSYGTENWEFASTEYRCDRVHHLPAHQIYYRQIHWPSAAPAIISASHLWAFSFLRPPLTIFAFMHLLYRSTVGPPHQA